MAAGASIAKRVPCFRRHMYGTVAPSSEVKETVRLETVPGAGYAKAGVGPFSGKLLGMGFTPIGTLARLSAVL